MITVNKYDYIIALVDDKKLFGRVVSAEKEVISFLPETKNLGEETNSSFVIDCKDVIANLGPEPFFGSVYSKTTLVYRKTLSVDEYPVEVYRKLNKPTRKLIESSLSSALEQLTTFKIKYAPQNVVFKILPEKGKLLGTYKHSRDVEKKLHEITLYTKWEQDSLGVEDLVDKPKDVLERYVWLHELGHYYWFNHTSKKQRAEWVEIYSNHVSVNSYSKEQVSDLLKLTDSSNASSLKELSQELPKEERWVLSDISHWIWRKYNLTLEDLLDLKNSGRDISPFWPRLAFNKSNKDSTPITKYAMTNVREFFAEAFAFHTSGMKLTKEITSLISKTIANFRS